MRLLWLAVQQREAVTRRACWKHDVRTRLPTSASSLPARSARSWQTAQVSSIMDAMPMSALGMLRRPNVAPTTALPTAVVANPRACAAKKAVRTEPIFRSSVVSHRRASVSPPSLEEPSKAVSHTCINKPLDVSEMSLFLHVCG